MVNEGKAVFYIGFDRRRTVSMWDILWRSGLMKRLQMAGNKPIALDRRRHRHDRRSFGRSDMRQMMTPEMIQHNCDCFKKQMSRFIDFSEGKAHDGK